LGLFLCILLACGEKKTGQKGVVVEAPAQAEVKRQVTPLAVCDTQSLSPLSAAQKYFDEGKFEAALSCASKAQAQTPDDPFAHSERAAALTALGRFEEAKLAYARALALDSENLDALLGAAHLYGVSLPSSSEVDELAALYAEKGLLLATDVHVRTHFELLSAMLANDRGLAQDALDFSEHILSLEPENEEAKYEHAVALYELCRFSEARFEFESLLKNEEKRAYVHHYLGLLYERENKPGLSKSHFENAIQLSPDEFSRPPTLSEAEFQKAVESIVDGLPPDMRQDLRDIPITTADIPSIEDLTAVSPPLSPTILGLFRGPPLGELCLPEDAGPDGGSCRSIVVYRNNLARTVKNRAEFLEQIRVTLLHEIGHLRGEDDLELAARGLE